MTPGRLPRRPASPTLCAPPPPQLKAQLNTRRASLTLFKSPLRTLSAFAACAGQAAWRGAAWLLGHPVFLFALVPVVLLYGGLKVTGAAAEGVREAELWLLYVMWWVGLGVLSSIGLGTGMHSGLLFLFPHILKVGGGGAAGRVVGCTHVHRQVLLRSGCGQRDAASAGWRKEAGLGLLWVDALWQRCWAGA